jgi:Uncharacterized protein containing a NRPS condensation (elongation) domain
MNIENLHKELPERIPAEISDQIQFFLRTYADQQMRFVIAFSQHINLEVLEKAMRLAIYAEPVFSYFYKEGAKTSWWQKQEVIDTALLIDLIEVKSDPENEIDNFLTLEIQPFSFPIVRARVIRNGQKDILCINMNHTPTDGVGLKEFVKILASIYTNLITNPEFEPKPEINGDRSLKQVTDHFTFFQKLKFAREGFRAPKKALSWSFDWARTGEEWRKFITTIKLTSDTFDRIKTYSKVNNVSVNDIVLAAFIRSFESTDMRNHYAAKPVIIPVDLRKYIKEESGYPICSLTGSLTCNIGKVTGPSFKDTVMKVRDEMNKKKEAHAEMNRITQIAVLSRIIPYGKLKEKLMNMRMPPIPLVTNIGIIKQADVNFNDVPVEDAFVTGAISFEDYFSMGFSTFQNVITFSIGYSGGDEQEQKVKVFLNDLKTELESIR